MTLCYPINRKVCPSIFCRIPNNSSTPFSSLCFTTSLFILRWSLTTLRHATSRMASHSTKRYTQVNLKRPQDHSLVSNDVPLASSNSSSSRNTQVSSNTHNDIVAKSRRNRTYLDKEDDEFIASFANRKRLTSKRLGVEQNARKAKLSSSSDLHSPNQLASADVTSRKNGATRKLNEKASLKVKEESPW